MKIIKLENSTNLILVLIFLVLITWCNAEILGQTEENTSSPNMSPNLTYSISTKEARISTPKYHLSTNKLTLKLDNVPEIIKQGQPASNTKWTFEGLPGAPQLPMRSYCVLLPPNAEPTSVKIEMMEDTPINLTGKYYFPPAPFPIALTANGTVISQSTDMSYLYLENSLWPSEPIQNFRVEQMRDAGIAQFSYYPCQYNPVKWKVIEHKDVQVSLCWNVKERTKVDPLTMKFLTSFGEDIDNFNEIFPMYEEEVFTTNGGLPSQSGSGYVIVTTNAIEANSLKLDDFVRYKQALGFAVQVITEDDYGSDTGKNRTLNIRSWLQNHYVSDSIEYVLLVGNPDPDEEDTPDTYGDVPMLMCWPRRSSSSNRESPTDYFYADLTGDWDSDGDGYYGNYSSDSGVDFAAEVYVGRIPVYNAEYSTLDSILQGIIDHHVNADSEKMNVLLPMAISNYANEDSGGYSRTDSLNCSKEVWDNILSPVGGITDTVMYERSGINPVPSNAFHYDMPLNSSNVISEMNNGHGAVFWWGHGSTTGATRKYWSFDDGDGVPEAFEMVWDTFIQSSDMSSLETDQPCFTYQSSCENGRPEATNNLGYALLERGAAVSTVSASRVSWYAVGTWYSSYPASLSDNTGLGYYYMRNLLRYNQTAGAALFSAKSSGGDGWGGPSWMNKMDFNLYGDPQLNYWGSNQPNIPMSPSPSNGATIGTTSVTLSVDVSDPDGDTLTVVFFNASDDSLIGEVSGVSSGGTASVTWSGFSDFTTYSWYVIVGDSQVTRQSSTKSFTVQIDITDPTWDENPTFQSIEYSMSFSYDVNATDNVGISYYWVNDTTEFSISGDGLITNISTLELGNYWIEVRAYDESTNYCTATIKVTVQDTTDPTWLQIPSDQTTEYVIPFNYDVNASDNHNIDHYWLNDTTYFTIDMNGRITNTTKLDLGNYWIEVQAWDESSNYITASIKIAVQDTTDPTWLQIPSDQTTEYAIPFNYDVNASDSHSIDHYWINDTTEFSIDEDGLITNVTTLELDNYWIEVQAYDESTNYCTATIKVTIQDTTDPTWNETPTNQIEEYGVRFSYDINSSDSHGIDHYWINDTTQFVINMDGVITNATELDLGIYWIEIHAYDTSNNYCLATIRVTVHDTTDPTWNETPTNQIEEFAVFFSYNVNISDDHSIDHYWINDTTHFSIGVNGVITNATELDLGDYWIDLRAYDASKNYCTVMIKVTIQDTINPIWDETLSNQVIEYGTDFVYDVNASDIYGVDHYWINDTIHFSISKTGVITNTNKLDVDIYWLEVQALDSSGNYCSAKIKIIIHKITTAKTQLHFLPAIAATFIISLFIRRLRPRKFS